MVISPWGKEQTEFFFSLTPDNVLSAVESAGYECTGRCTALNSFENRVYDIELEEKQVPPNPEISIPASNHVIAKFYRPGRWTREQILEEHEFLLDLLKAEVPVVAPIPFPDGETLKVTPQGGIFYALFPRVGGRAPDELSDEQIERVGRLLARIHGVGAIKPAANRIRIDPATYGTNNLRYLTDRRVVPPEFAGRYTRAVERLVDTVTPWFEQAPIQRIHGDCHFGNLLWNQNGPFFLDFDDMVRGPCVQDIWLMLPGRDEEARQKRGLLLEAYEQMRAFDRTTLRLIEPLRALRFVHFAAWIARRWDDPAFPRAFPQFGTDRYWQEQTQDLEEQLRLIVEGEPTSYAAEDDGKWGGEWEDEKS